MIRFKCGKCDRPLQVRDDFAGRAMKCPDCRQSITAPSPNLSPAVPESHRNAGDDAPFSFGDISDKQPISASKKRNKARVSVDHPAPNERRRSGDESNRDPKTKRPPLPKSFVRDNKVLLIIAAAALVVVVVVGLICLISFQSRPQKTPELAAKQDRLPLVEKDGTLTTRFYPCKPGDVKQYITTTYFPDGTPSGAFSMKHQYGNGTYRATIHSTIRHGTDTYSLRAEEGFIKDGPLWKFKLGAKPGDKWYDNGFERPHDKGKGGDDPQPDIAWTFERFDKKGGSVFAVLRGKSFKPRDTQIIIEVEEVYERDVGLVSEQTWHDHNVRGARRFLYQHKKLVAADTEFTPFSK